MWRNAKCVLFLIFFLHRIGSAQLQPVGNWQDHLPYQNAIAITAADNLIWGATTNGLVRFDPAENSIERKSSIHGLGGRIITTIAAIQELVVIAYSNSTVDLLQGDNIRTIREITFSTIAPVKTIHHIFINAPFIYLSTAFGIVVLHIDKGVISDTYVIGNAGEQIAVYATAIADGFLYAATDQGLKRIALNSGNPSDFANWEQLFNDNAAVKSLVNFGKLIFQQRDTLFIFNNNIKEVWYTSGWEIGNINITGDKLLVAERNSDSGRAIELQADGTVSTIIQDPWYTGHVKQVAWLNGKYYIADSIAGFSSFHLNLFNPFLLNAPAAAALGDIVYSKETIWAASGNITGSRQPANNRNGVFFFRDTRWSNLHFINIPALDSFPDIVSLAADPLSDAVWAGSFGNGLARISGNQVELFKQNTGLAPVVNTANDYRVSALAFDSDNNLWIANDGASQPLVVRQQNNTWTRFSLPYNLPGNALSEIIIDNNNFKWMIAPGYGLIVFDHGRDISNTADDRYRLFRSGTGNGNLPDNEILSIAKDRNGFIWIGTAKGIGIITCTPVVFSNNACETILPVVQQNNFPGYLFRDEAVQVIAVDGADRKWIGTRNGVWLISADGDKTIHHFTVQNSPLPDNDIRGIAVHGQTGEVFISTAAGIVSFRSDATEPVNNGKALLIFPNPVPPGYSGTIAIRGVPANSVVKITETDGRLVYQTKSIGGQAIWNGKDYKGRTVASGVYLVLVSDELSSARIAGKIVFIKK